LHVLTWGVLILERSIPKRLVFRNKGCSSLVKHPKQSFYLSISLHNSNRCGNSYLHVYFIFIPFIVPGRWWLMSEISHLLF
jgi:hypothetical protein